MTWDVTYFDDATGTAYRVRAKRLTMRDGAALDQAIVEASRPDVDDLEFNLRQMAAYITHGTQEAQRASFAAPPTEDEMALAGVPWVPLAPTLDTVADLDEQFVQGWYLAVLARNPHRNSLYEALKKSLLKGDWATANSANSTASETSESTIDDGTRAS